MDGAVLFRESRVKIMQELAENAHWLALILVAADLLFLPNFVANFRCAPAYRSIAAQYLFICVADLFSSLPEDDLRCRFALGDRIGVGFFKPQNGARSV